MLWKTVDDSKLIIGEEPDAFCCHHAMRAIPTIWECGHNIRVHSGRIAINSNALVLSLRIDEPELLLKHVVYLLFELSVRVGRGSAVPIVQLFVCFCESANVGKKCGRVYDDYVNVTVEPDIGVIVVRALTNKRDITSEMTTQRVCDLRYCVGAPLALRLAWWVSPSVDLFLAYHMGFSYLFVRG
jgi:hypothetical protein